MTHHIKLSEQNVRTLVAVGLWLLSGAVMASLFFELAGPDPVARSIGISWALLLQGAMVLCWRVGGWRRAITLVLELIVMAATFDVAWARIQATRTDSFEAVLQRIHGSSEWKETTAELDEARGLLAALTARLDKLPPDFTTAAREVSLNISDDQARIGHLSQKLASMEHVSGTTSPNLGLFSLAGEDSSWLELGLVMLVALLTEGAALALIGRAQPEGATSAVNEPASKDTSKPVSSRRRGSQTKSETVSPEDRYLAVVRLNQKQGLPDGYRTVAKTLGISERQARYIRDALVQTGKLG